MAIVIKSKHEIDIMREAGRIVAEALAVVQKRIKPEISTAELDALAFETIEKYDAIPSFKGYQGFPASICASLNEELVHGIPSQERILEEGDILTVDLGVIYKGFQGDSAVTIPVGEINGEAQRLLDATKGALGVGIEQLRPDNRVGDVSAVIQEYVEARGFSVVRKYCGHGIGRDMHEDPQVPNYGSRGRGAPLRPGMTVAIEPMVNAGSSETTVLDDGWTVVTADGKLSAHFEHTVAVTEDGPQILTRAS